MSLLFAIIRISNPMYFVDSEIGRVINGKTFKDVGSSFLKLLAFLKVVLIGAERKTVK